MIKFPLLKSKYKKTFFLSILQRIHEAQTKLDDGIYLFGLVVREGEGEGDMHSFSF